MAATASFMRPQLAFAPTFKWKITTGKPASRPIAMASSMALKRLKLSPRTCVM